MAKPPVPYWDKNLLHRVAPFSTHIDNGYAADEVPGSNEWNGQFNEIGVALGYHSERLIVDAVRHLVPMLDPTNGSALDPDFPGQSPSTDCIYALTLHGGSAYLKAGSTTSKIKISSGILMQLRGGELYAYASDGTKEFTIAAGDATNPRVDLLQVAIDRDAVTMVPTITLTVKQGTPGASPVYPAPDAGTCVIGAVVVGATWAGGSISWGIDTAGATLTVHDQRFPIGVKTVTVQPKEAIFAADWTYPPAGSPETYIRKLNNLAGQSMYFVPDAPPTSRLLAVSQAFLDTNSQDSRLTRMKYEDNGGGSITRTDIDLAHANMNGSGSGQYIRRTGGLLGFQLSTKPMFAAGPTVQANANGMGPPIWMNGRRCANPYRERNDDGSPTGDSAIALRWIATGTADMNSYWTRAIFYVCEGL